MRTTTYVPGTPRWARIAAHAVPLAVLPSGLWRLLMTAGAAGVDHSADPGHRSTLADYAYVLALSLVSEGLALLTLGLVKPWGERVPRRVPLLGGRRVPVRAAVLPAATGVVLLTLIAAWYVLDPLLFHVHFTPSVGDKGTPDSHLEVSGWSRVLFAACYLPLLLWPPLLAAVTLAYHRRRTAGPTAPGTVRRLSRRA
ncbi:hypothetical protein HUT16_21225 [Kitasatospora sp. NA04385]|uniref:hypothetical protein n=1 Tax=Kitasatospora sp. NA04385 TaxID=2742135 RepID=UPI001591B753|nr:hypothetical protein [Kitasatospora sp. NA04385]QKW21245.1 hypothetical protein HUT16_21225 [Kitasatospora sp. NA04385]